MRLLRSLDRPGWPLCVGSLSAWQAVKGSQSRPGSAWQPGLPFRSSAAAAANQLGLEAERPNVKRNVAANIGFAIR